MKPYADTNFLVRLYLELPDSDAVLELIETGVRLGNSAFPVTWLHRVELCNAVQLYVFQHSTPRRRVTPEQAASAWAFFRDEMESPSRLRPTVMAVSELDKQFEQLSFRYTARHGFRTYDLLHVASALLLECDAFWSFDVKATRLAALEGLKVLHTRGKP